MSGLKLLILVAAVIFQSIMEVIITTLHKCVKILIVFFSVCEHVLDD